MAIVDNVVFQKKIGSNTRTITIHSAEVIEDYVNDVITIIPGKGQSGQDVTGKFTSGKTRVKDRVRVEHSVQVSGQLADDGSTSAEEQKNILIQMMLNGNVEQEPVKVTAGLKIINSGGSLADETFEGVIKSINTKKVPGDVNTQANEVIDVQLLFIESNFTLQKGFLLNRDQRA